MAYVSYIPQPILHLSVLCVHKWGKTGAKADREQVKGWL